MMIMSTAKAAAGQGTLWVGGIGAGGQVMVMMAMITMVMLMMMMRAYVDYAQYMVDIKPI